MEIKRQQEIVEAYHYDMRVPDSEVETDLRVSFSPIEVEEENYPENSSALVARLEFELSLTNLFYQGRLAKLITLLIVKLKNKKIFRKKKSMNLCVLYLASSNVYLMK